MRATSVAETQDSPRIGFRRTDQVDGRTGTASPGKIAVDEFRCRRIAGTGRTHQFCGVCHHCIGNGDPRHEIVDRQNIFGIDHRFDLSEFIFGNTADDLHFFFFRGITHIDLEQEAVLLRFRQRISTLLLNGVLGRHHQERLRKLESLLSDGHLTLLHGLEKSRLHLCRRTVDLVGKDEISEDRTFLDLELLCLL